jgi:hypothetical protein
MGRRLDEFMHEDARPAFRGIAGCMGVLAVIVTVGALVGFVVWREWWILGVVAIGVLGSIECFSIARHGR